MLELKKLEPLKGFSVLDTLGSCLLCGALAQETGIHATTEILGIPVAFTVHPWCFDETGGKLPESTLMPRFEVQIRAARTAKPKSKPEGADAVQRKTEDSGANRKA